MESYHWFLMGMMVAWTPCLIILSIMLCRTKSEPASGEESVWSLDSNSVPFASQGGQYSPASVANPGNQLNGELGSYLRNDNGAIALLRIKE